MQRTSQSTIWMLAAALLAIAGVLAIVFSDTATAGLVFVVIAGLFLVVAVTQGAGRSGGRRPS